MSEDLVSALSGHLLNRQNYQEDKIEKCKPWIELSQNCHEILFYPISQDFNSSKKRKFVHEVEFTYRFMHPAIAPTFKYTYLDDLSISYIGNKDSLFLNQKLSNTNKQIILIGVASALLYLEAKGLSHYCLDINHLLLNKMKFPKLVCTGVPTVFMPDDWDNDFSSIQSFGNFAQTILSNQDNIPSSIQTLIDKCINIRSTASTDAPTFGEILSTLSSKNNYLHGADESAITKYIQWLEFQDKFPCEYFFELGQEQCDALINAIKPSKSHGEDNESDGDSDDGSTYLCQKLFKGIDGFPKDIFGASYLAQLKFIEGLPRYNWRLSRFIKEIHVKAFLKYYGAPDWFKNSHPIYERLFTRLDKDAGEIDLDPCNEFMIDNEKYRNKFHSTDSKDLLFVTKSYLSGKNGFRHSQESAFYFLKNSLKKDQNKIKDPSLLKELGKMYHNGIGTIQNLPRAIECYELAGLDQSDDYFSRAQNELEELEKQISNLSAECKQRIENAESNDFKDLMRVAFSFLHGFDGFPKSHRHALMYYKKAAEIDPYIYCMFGNMFRLGIIFPKNIHKAAKFYALANIHGCLRGQYYDGFMKMREYYPLESSKRPFKVIDKYFFDFKNKQGKSNPFNYCKMIQLSQMHFPIMISYYIYAEDSYRASSRTDGIDYRIQNDTTFVKESIKSNKDVDNHKEDDDRFLMDTEVQISLWFLLYQVKYLIDNGILCENQKPLLSLYKDGHYYYFSITNIKELYSWEKGKTLAHLIFKKFKKSIPALLKSTVRDIVKSEMTIDELLEYLENNLLSKRVDQDVFHSFVRKCKNFVPLDSSKILLSDVIDKAESGDKDSIQECAHNYFYGLHSFPINFNESFKYYQILANDPFNDPNAQMWLGIMLSKGIGVKQDNKAAIEWFKKSSNQDFIKGKLNTALFLEYYNRKIKKAEDPPIPYINILVKCVEAQDKEALFQMGKLKESHASWEYGRTKSIKYYQRASHLGHIESTRRLYHVYKKLGMNNEQRHLLSFLRTINDQKYTYLYAKRLYNKGDYENSIKYTQIMLPTKDAKVRKLYADHLLNGHGIEKDIKAAKEFYIAVLQTYPQAVVALANIYEKGIEGEPDLLKARKIYFQAIKDAMHRAKPAYRKLYCDFCEKHNYYKAAFNFHLQLALNNNIPESQYKVAMSYFKPPDKAIKKDFKKGRDFLRLSADQHYPDATYKLGKSYIYGKYKQKRDFDKGVEYLKLASYLNCTKATFLLGEIYYHGIGTIPSLKKAYEFFTKASSKGHAGAKYYLSLNEKLDDSTRQQYLIESADQGYAQAQYEYGMSLIKVATNEDDDDYQKGNEYIHKAAQQNHEEAKAYYHKLTAKRS